LPWAVELPDPLYSLKGTKSLLKFFHEYFFYEHINSMTTALPEDWVNDAT
jgi:hypothetical protein